MSRSFCGVVMLIHSEIGTLKSYEHVCKVSKRTQAQVLNDWDFAFVRLQMQILGIAPKLASIQAKRFQESRHAVSCTKAHWWLIFEIITPTINQIWPHLGPSFGLFQKGAFLLEKSVERVILMLPRTRARILTWGAQGYFLTIMIFITLEYCIAIGHLYTSECDSYWSSQTKQCTTIIAFQYKLKIRHREFDQIILY